MTPTHPFPLTTHLRLTLYIIALVSVAAFAHTESTLAYLFPTLITAVIAWLLVDSPFAPSLDTWLAGLIPARPNAPAAQKIFRRLLRYTPKLFLNLVVLVAAIYFWFEARQQVIIGNQSLILALAHFIIVLLISKLFERKTPRDAAQILVLSLLLIIAATIFSTEGLFFFLILAVFFSLCVYAIILLNVSTAVTSLASPIPAAIPLSDLPRNRRPDPNAPLSLFRRDLIAAAKYCLFLTLPIAICIFLAVPRSRGNPLLSPLGLGADQTGYSETPQFRDYGQLQLSDREVMRVNLQRRGLDDSTGDYTDLYFRGQVFDQFGPNGWSHGPFSVAPPAGPDAPPPDAPRSSQSIKVTYILEHPVGQALFILGPSEAPPGDNLVYRREDMVLRFVRSRSRLSEPFTYSLLWTPDLAANVPGEPFCEPGLLAPAGQRRSPNGTTTEIPPVKVSPQIDELAHRLVKDILPSGTTPQPDQIRLVLTAYETYLRTNYPYSLTFKRVDPTLDPVTDFLLNRKDSGAHCEYFASAMVMLCRAVGINARRVDGFHGGEFVPATVGNKSYYLIRDKHAHAWAEAYIPGQGWVLCDATPIGSGSDAASLTGNWFNDVSRIIQSAWLATVISFDNDSRDALARWLSERFHAIISIPPWPVAIAVFLWIVTLALILLFLLLRRRFRALKPLLESTNGIPHRQLRLTTHIPFLEDLLHLFERPAPRRPDLTPLEFLSPHFPHLGTAAADARWLIHTAYAVRFNNLRLDPALKHDIARALKSVKAAKQNP